MPSLLPPTCIDVVEVDGKEVHRQKSRLLDGGQAIRIAHFLDQMQRTIEVRLAMRSLGLGFGCQILVDDHLIGGDVAIRYTDSNRAMEQLDQGFVVTLFKHGIVKYGVPCALLGMLLLRNQPIEILGAVAGTLVLAFGLLGGITHWRGLKRVVQRSNARV